MRIKKDRRHSMPITHTSRNGNTYYQPVLRFILADAERRLFAPERCCFRCSVDDWINIGPAERIDKLAAKYLKHLGQDSMYELF